MNSSHERNLQGALEDLRRELRKTRFCVICSTLCLGGAGITALFAFASTRKGGVAGLGLSLALGVLGCLLLPKPRANPLQRLFELEDTRCVGVLLDALPVASGTMYEEAIRLLTHLLPKLDSSVPLTHKQRKILCDALAHGNIVDDSAFLSAILDSLPVIGAISALPTVRILAERVALHPVEKAVRAKAQECLPVLEESARELRDYGSLLRPSDGREPPDVLLRPATATFDDPSELLRAESSEPENKVVKL
ncbi:MAG: hypothetical protein NT023_19000 [Armatimonadetes bacterium]|nr:hypothetical protein [Armatimonadota bacterium]